jgi:predicted small lipoprotein YifL
MTKTVFTLLILSVGLTSCGKEGPFGNTPGPKKPAQMVIDAFR